MIFNMNDFLRAIANVLDSIEIAIFGMPTNHSKRIAYISVMIARELRLTNEEIFDLASLAIMHDNGASIKILRDKLSGTPKEKIDFMESRKEHCIIGEENIRNFPFLTNPKNIIEFHHEKYDGSGFFGLLQNEIPLMAQIIALSDTLDLSFDIRDSNNKEIIIAYVHEHKDSYFSPLLSAVYEKLAKDGEFWDAISDGNIDDSLKSVIPIINNEFTYNELRIMTKTFSHIIDAHSEFTQAHSSGLSEKVEILAGFYKMDSTMTLKLLIAADLHDLGKLVISNDVLDKPGDLTKDEFKEIKKHPGITGFCLQNIDGFEEITKWASNHHEKLDGSGYPNGLTAKDLDFNSRIITCLDIYQALREDRPYRSAMNHSKSMDILQGMAESGQLDHHIVNDIGFIFGC
ncbi:MAG: HD-GYP domain-containing protein [Saccharofermentanales bacterium]